MRKLQKNRPTKKQTVEHGILKSVTYGLIRGSFQTNVNIYLFYVLIHSISSNSIKLAFQE